MAFLILLSHGHGFNFYHPSFESLKEFLKSNEFDFEFESADDVSALKMKLTTYFKEEIEFKPKIMQFIILSPLDNLKTHEISDIFIENSFDDCKVNVLVLACDLTRPIQK